MEDRDPEGPAIYCRDATLPGTEGGLQRFDGWPIDGAVPPFALYVWCPKHRQLLPLDWPSIVGATKRARATGRKVTLWVSPENG